MQILSVLLQPRHSTCKGEEPSGLQCRQREAQVWSPRHDASAVVSLDGHTEDWPVLILSKTDRETLKEAKRGLTTISGCSILGGRDGILFVISQAVLQFVLSPGVLYMMHNISNEKAWARQSGNFASVLFLRSSVGALGYIVSVVTAWADA